MIYLDFGIKLITYSITGWKSIDNSLSASSKISISHLLKSAIFLFYDKSKILPGEPKKFIYDYIFLKYTD